MASAKRGEICSQCHQLHPKCLGHWRKIPDKPCNHKPKQSLKGSTDFCRYHGGTKITRQIKNKLAREREVARYLHQMDLELIGDAMPELENAVAQAKAIYEFYRDSVGQMTAAEQRFKSEAGIEQLRSETLLMERALDRYMGGLATLQKLRRADNTASAGETLLDLIKSGIDNRP